MLSFIFIRIFTSWENSSQKRWWKECVLLLLLLLKFYLHFSLSSHFGNSHGSSDVRVFIPVLIRASETTHPLCHSVYPGLSFIITFVAGTHIHHLYFVTSYPFQGSKHILTFQLIANTPSICNQEKNLTVMTVTAASQSFSASLHLPPISRSMMMTSLVIKALLCSPCRRRSLQPRESSSPTSQGI